MSDANNISGADEDGLLAAEYTLGLLTPAERERVAQRARAEAPLRAEIAFWRQRLASLDVEFAETPVPGKVWSGIEKRLFADAARPGFWNSLALWRSLSAAALAVAVVAIGVNVMTPRPDPNTFATQLVAALSAQGSNVSMVALYNANTGQVRLTAISGDKLTDKDYELWAIEGSNAPKSMGVIKIDARNDVKVAPDILAEFGPGTTLALTLEPLGGSPTGGPTGPVVAAGAATQI